MISPIAIGVVVALAVLAGVGIEVAAAVRAQHTAAGAADLAALAASRAVESGQDACAVADDIARRNGATVVECRLDAAVATITTEVTVAGWIGDGWVSRRTARAAPASYLDAPE